MPEVSRYGRMTALMKIFTRWLCCCLAPVVCASANGGEPSSPAFGGTSRARVVIMEDPQATRTFQPDKERVRRLVDQGVTNFTGQASLRAAWRSLVSTQDVIGLKVYSAPGPHVGTRPAVVEAVAQGLLKAGMAARNIVIWDRQLEDLQRGGFEEMARRLGVRVAGAIQEGWDEKVFYETPFLGRLVHGDLEFHKNEEPSGRKSHVSRLVTKELTRIINITPMLNHNSAGVCGNLYGLALGSIDNGLRFEGDTGRLAQAVPEIYALPVLGDRVALNIVDALVAQYEGEQVGRLHYSTALNQVRLGADPVALDVLSILELDRQRELHGMAAHANTNVLELYRNASLLEIGVSEPRRILVETVK
jgi:hypothetical protein